MFKKLLLVAASALICSSSYAWDSKRTGKIDQFTVSNGFVSNRDIMLTLEGSATMCDRETNNQVAYVKKSESPDTFATFMSTLLAAKTTGREVKLYITSDGANGCRIDALNLLD